jgi:GNAT superfamily N-acetyltransferase
MTEFAVETFMDIVPEIEVLAELHYKEIAKHQDKIKLNPDYDKYSSLEQAGILHTVTARKDGVLIGYVVSLVDTHLHYKDLYYAMNDVLFIHPDYRGTGVAYRMLKYSEEKLKEIGADLIMFHVKCDHDFKPLCDKLGYNRVEYNYSKYIGG